MKKTNSRKEFFKAIERLAEENLIPKEEIYKIIHNVVLKIFRVKFDPDADLELIIDPGKNKFSLINHSKLVVEGEVPEKSRPIEISLKEAKKIKKDVKVNDVVSEEVNFDIYSRTLAEQIKQFIMQHIREKKRKVIYNKYKDLIGQMISATVASVGRNYAVLTLDDGTITFMPPKYKNPKIHLELGEKIKVYIEEVKEEAKDAQVIVSNGSVRVIRRLLEIEIPEIQEGIVEIVNIARVPGIRTKVAVRSLNPDVDPVGAIIGQQGQRISSIISKLEGEKIDVISYSEDINTFIINALSPAKVIAIFDKTNEDNEVVENHKIVITPDLHQTLAIGKKGTNAKLAVELTKTKIDIIALEEAKKKNVDFEWNGNVSEEDLKKIEAGLTLTRQPKKRNDALLKAKENFTNEFDREVETFREGMEVEKEEEESEDYSDDNQNFEDFISDEELKKIEEEFERIDNGKDDSK